MMWKLEGAPSGISATDSLQSVMRRSLPPAARSLDHAGGLRYERRRCGACSFPSRIPCTGRLIDPGGDRADGQGEIPDLTVTFRVLGAGEHAGRHRAGAGKPRGLIVDLVGR